MVTIKEIAKEVGVSVAAVSQVLNNKENSFISQSTKEAIWQVAQELNYIPNRVARDLVRGSTMLLGIIIPDAKSPFFSETVPGIEDSASVRGYDVMCSYSAGDFEKERKYIQLFLERKVDGLIIAPLKDNRNVSVFRKLLQQKTPFVLIDRYIPDLETDFVVSDLKEGAYEAVAYLIQSGHTNIAHITEKSNISTVRDVLKGYEMAFARNNLLVKRELIEGVNPEFASDDFDAGYKGMKELLQKKIFTAVFCVGDEFAVGAVKALKEAGLRIPEDISVMGMDNLNLSSYLSPGLTSVAQDKTQMGKIAAEILMERIKDPAGKKKQIFLKPHLVLRGSTQDYEQSKDPKYNEPLSPDKEKL